MKYSITKSILLIASPILFLTLVSCGTKNQENYDNKESKEVAEERNDDKFDDKDTEKDAQFVVDAVSSNLAEIKLATLAEERGVSKEVKDLAAVLKKQHTELLNALKKYAEAKVISIPSEETNKVDNTAEKLNDNKGFDEKWCAEMKDMHEKSIKKFEDASNDLADAELKNLASQALPTLRTHYDKIVACDENLKKK